MRADPRELFRDGGPEQEIPGWLAACLPVLRLRALVERYGFAGALTVAAVERLHPAAAEAMEILDAELAGLERAQRRAEAERRRAEKRDAGGR